MRKLELENERLREHINKHMAIYRDQLYKIADLEVKLEMVKEAITC